MHAPSSEPDPDLASALATALATERLLLAALCRRSTDLQTRQDLLERLARHTFRSVEHEVIFRALAALGPHELGRLEPGDLRQILQSRVTRLGFPDADVDSLFALATPSEQLRAVLKGL
jgi:hypothetical protein